MKHLSVLLETSSILHYMVREQQIYNAAGSKRKQRSSEKHESLYHKNYRETSNGDSTERR